MSGNELALGFLSVFVGQILKPNSSSSKTSLSSSESKFEVFSSEEVDSLDFVDDNEILFAVSFVSTASKSVTVSYYYRDQVIYFKLRVCAVYLSSHKRN